MRKAERTLISVEQGTLAYIGFTAVLVLVYWHGMESPWHVLAGRAAIMAGMALFYGFYQLRPNKLTYFCRHAFPLFMLAYWYPDIYEFSRQLPNFDHIFAAVDLEFFGCQPSVEMSKLLKGRVWDELFNLGYISYFPMIFLTCYLPVVSRQRGEFSRTGFIILASFFIYYLVYLFLPVAGPHYYFSAIDPELVAAGPYPDLGYYFSSHADLVCTSDGESFFKQLVEATQQSGERPVAAFPSSHVGLSTITMALCWRQKKAVFFIFLPLYLLLCGATVFIGAHYLIDALCGFLVAPPVYAISEKIYKRICHTDLSIEHTVNWTN